MLIQVILLLYQLVNVCVSNEEILGCGGFIKSDVQLDFSRVQIKLYTKKGVLKDSTDCAPNNGYYFIPLYDKGEYILKVEPPAGWSFDKTEIQLNVDGKTDACSLGKDINFNFKGFGITGRVVSVNSIEGPAGVHINYVENGNSRETITTDGGNFNFTPVIPGRYTIVASHPKWKFLKNVVNVEVKKENTELRLDSFIVAGYDVSGYVEADSKPIDNIYFVLFNPKIKDVLAGCSTEQIPGFQSNYGKSICSVQSDNGGRVYFPTVPPGNYKLVPFYKKNTAIFEIMPSSLDFTVGHNSVELDTKFEVIGLTLTGRVLLSVKDTVATILLDNGKSTTTDKNGQYTLTNIYFGTYQISAEAPEVRYPELKIEITPTQFTLPDLKPNAYKSCGQVISDNQYAVEYIHQSNGNVFHTRTDPDDDGTYCLYLPPGAYQVKVVPDPFDPPNVQFFPSFHTVEVTDKPPTKIVFSQLKAMVFGSVECFIQNECEHLTIQLRSQTPGIDTEIHKAVTIDGKYKFRDIPPGRYEVSAAGNALCWDNPKHYIAISSAEATVSAFKQTGYRIIFNTIHETEIHYSLLNENNSAISKNIIRNPAGSNSHCLKQPGRYRFVAVGCHGYEPKFVEWSTSTQLIVTPPVVFNEVTHAHLAQILSTDKKDMYIEVYNEENQFLYKMEPKKPEKVVQTDRGQKFAYQFHLQIAENDVIVIVPKSDVMLFQPKTLRIVGDSDCVPMAGEIYAEIGKIIKGEIVPPLSGVMISVSANNQVVATIETKSDGQYHLGPLDNSVDYQLNAVKDNYFIKGPDKNGNFVAHKMADILIKAVDQADNSTLAGVLVSVSGGGNYRKNLQTTNDGTIQFTSLNPGEYFMRPMMKEYRFEPNSKMLTVREGESLQVIVAGKRVAFSAYGSVRTLSGIGEVNVVVEARAKLSANMKVECKEHVEEATTDITGAFRIRGLLPGCSYQLQLKSQLDVEGQQSSVYSFDNVKGDIHNIKLICLQPPTYTDVTVHVYTEKPENYRTLRVNLGQGDLLSNPIQSVRLDPQIVATRKLPIPEPGVLVVFNSLPYDQKQYYVQLDSSLSQASHSYENNPVTFYANTSFKHVNLKFAPKVKVTEYDMSQTSILALPLLVVIGLLFYNMHEVFQIVSSNATKLYEHILDFFQVPAIGQLNASKQTSSEFVHTDYAEIDQIVQNINAVKQKPKKRVLLIS